MQRLFEADSLLARSPLLGDKTGTGAYEGLRGRELELSSSLVELLRCILIISNLNNFHNLFKLKEILSPNMLGR